MTTHVHTFGNDSSGWALRDYALVLSPVLTFLSAAFFFWWLNARSGRIDATRPRAFGFRANSDAGGLRLRLPLVLFNTGAKALIVVDLRVVLDDETGALLWATTRTLLDPEKVDGFAFPTPFAVPGRGTKEVIAEFEPSVGFAWSPLPASEQPMRLQGQIHPKETWVDLVVFDLRSPVSGFSTKYLAYRNERQPPDVFDAFTAP